MFTVFVGAVGTGKTYSLAREGKRAFEAGETIWSNVPLDVSGWNQEKGGKYIFWSKPNELTNENVHCGTVLFDELGEAVNNRETDFWDFELTLKLIEHRKDHLDFFATVQDDELADKNVRRFYNRVKFLKEHRWPFVGLFFPSSVRTDLPCPYPNCHKGDGLLTHGDKGWFWPGTFYSAYDVHPQDTKNKYKHRSQGKERYCWDAKVAYAYASSMKLASAVIEDRAEKLKKMGQKSKRRWH